MSAFEVVTEVRAPGNPGVVHLGPAASGNHLPRTFIITGLGRSGTSMTAAVFEKLGLLSARDAYPVTLDDREFLDALTRRDRTALGDAIARRNAREFAWAFKIPSIHGFLDAAEIDLFRAPHVILMMRDLAATARRHAIAEGVEPGAALFETADGMMALMGFVRALRCPVLVVSYEKAVAYPAGFVDALLSFAAVDLDDEARAELVRLIEPDSLAYEQVATRRFEGFVDGFIGEHLVGWCRDANNATPLHVDLLAGGRAVASMKADIVRQDLRQVGFDEVHHGFSFDTKDLALDPRAVLRVRLTGRLFEVPGSGRSVEDYAVLGG